MRIVQFDTEYERADLLIHIFCVLVQLCVKTRKYARRRTRTSGDNTVSHANSQHESPIWCMVRSVSVRFVCRRGRKVFTPSMKTVHQWNPQLVRFPTRYCTCSTDGIWPQGAQPCAALRLTGSFWFGARRTLGSIWILSGAGVHS